MKRKFEVTRRRFLLGLAATGVTFLLSALGIRFWRNTEIPPLHNALGRTSLLHWRILGQKYLARSPGEADFDRLMNEIFGPATSLPNQREVHEFLRSRVQGDFEKGSVVLIEGWILSQTEAKLAALAALDVP